MDAVLLCRTCMDFELWFYSYFWADFGIDCRIVLCRVFGMFCVVFVACFEASIGRILWSVDKGCSGMVSSQNRVYWSCQGALWQAIAWKPRYCVAGLKIEPLGMQLRGFPRNCVAPAHLQASNFGQS